jgi:uncharacterized membrane protein (DUF485 family)
MASDDPGVPPDPTPVIGVATDMARFTHAAPKPPHERTADEEARGVDWHKVASTPRFQNLLRAKRRFVVPAMVIFILYYFALLVLVGYARPFMEKRIFGAVNIAYLFALSQFFMAWIIAALYIRAAAKFDKMARDVVDNRK